MKKALAWLGIVWPYGAVFLTLLGPLLLLQKSFTLADYSVQHLPWAAQTFQSIRGGGLPLWTNAMCGGFPLFAEGQCGAVYFLNWIGYKALPFLTAYTWSIPLHVLVGGIGMFAYVRRLKLSAEAAMIAAVCFCFSSAYAGCFYNTGSLKTLCWLPGALFLLEILRAEKGRGQAAAFSALCFVISQQWVAGFPQMAVYAFGYLVLHEALILIEKKGLRGLFFLVPALAIGTMIAWPQVSTTLELIGRSVRQNESAAFALWGSVPPVAPVSLLFPEWGSALRISFYIGIAPLFLAGVLFLSRSGPLVRRQWLLAAVFFLSALGKHNPLYRMLIETLSLTSLRNPSKFLFFAVSALCVLAAYGYDRLTADPGDRPFLKKAERSALALAVAVWTLPGLAWICARLSEKAWPSFRQWYVSDLIAQKTDPKEPVYYMEQAETFFRSLPALFSYRNPLNLESALLAAATATAVTAFARGKIGVKRFFGLLSVVLVWDLLVFGFSLGAGFIGNAGPLKDLVPNAEKSRVAERLHQDPGLLVELTEERAHEFFPPNSHMTYGVKHAGGYSPLLLKDHYDLVKDLGIVDSSLGRPVPTEAVWGAQRGVLDLIGARYVRTDRPVTRPNWQIIDSGKGYFLYENLSALKTVTAYSRWSVVPDAAERLERIQSEDFDAAGEALLSDDRLLRGFAMGSERVNADFEVSGGSTPERLQMRVSLERDALVMVRLAAYPGWTLAVDGNKTEWTTVDHAFIGFPMRKGSHELTLSYRPSSWPSAWYLCALGIVTAFAGGAVLWRRR